MTRLTVVSITQIVFPVINKSIHITSVVTFWPHIIHIFNWQTKTTTWNLFDNRTWIVAFVMNIFSNKIWSPIHKIQIRRWWIEQKCVSYGMQLFVSSQNDGNQNDGYSHGTAQFFQCVTCIQMWVSQYLCTMHRLLLFFSFCHRTKNMLRQTTTHPICNGDFYFVFERCTSSLGCIMGWCVWIVKHQSTKVHITWESICWKK